MTSYLESKVMTLSGVKALPVGVTFILKNEHGASNPLVLHSVLALVGSFLIGQSKKILRVGTFTLPNNAEKKNRASCFD